MNEQNNLKEILELIQENCKPYIKRLKECDKYRILVRGTYDSIEIFNEYNHNLDNRIPRNMPNDIHNSINLRFLSEFGWKIRNGVFCFGYNLGKKNPCNYCYGPNYFIFPKGDFEFIYSQNISDLWIYFMQTKGETNELINDLVFSNGTLNDALKSGDIENGFSNEISLKTTNYYLVSMKLSDKIVEMIWG